MVVEELVTVTHYVAVPLPCKYLDLSLAYGMLATKHQEVFSDAINQSDIRVRISSPYHLELSFPEDRPEQIP